MVFRDLKAEEVLVRLQNKYNNRGLFLIYKDARVDMNILNETYGVGFWKREHFAINNYLCCRVSIYNEKLQSWVSCEDVGEEQTFEKVKSVFSDSFKRACFNFGIGIELYTAPKIVIDLKSGDLDAKGNLKNSFFVSEIETVNKVIQKLVIKDSQNNIRFTYDISKQVIDYNKIPNGKNKGKLWKDCDNETLNKALDFYTNKEKNENYIKVINEICQARADAEKSEAEKWDADIQ